MSELKPCPFCGGEAALSNAEAGTGGLPRTARNPRCTKCGSDMGYSLTPQDAADGWNRRPAEDRLREALEQCAEYFGDRSDVDTSDGEPVANKEMRLLGVVKTALGEK